MLACLGALTMALASAAPQPAALPWVDPHTPQDVRTIVPPMAAGPMNLVFSDEFEEDWPSNRTWTPNEGGVLSKKWAATYQLNTDTYGDTFLHPSMISASGGTLRINGTKQQFGGADYIGGQLTSWNRFCYQGGYLEVKYKLPGGPHELGVWPAVWIMGNLARDVFPSSGENVWPFTYDDCQCPGPAWRTGSRQRISRCDSEPPRYGLNVDQGRGAPELDLLETTLCERQMTPDMQRRGILANDTCIINSLQLAPRIPASYRPIMFEVPSADRPWYDGVSYGPGVQVWRLAGPGRLRPLGGTPWPRP